ncbi:MAG TPA: hypothetical protein VGD40_17120, partial [Chryseosolibacter sp.]
RGHALIDIPVTGFVLKACEEKSVVSHYAMWSFLMRNGRPIIQTEEKLPHSLPLIRNEKSPAVAED